MIRFEIKPEVVEWVAQEWVRSPDMAQELIEGLMGMMIAYGCISAGDDGRLKQAAPALLVVLRGLVDAYDTGREGNILAAYVKARAAIAEATGSDN